MNYGDAVAAARSSGLQIFESGNSRDVLFYKETVKLKATGEAVPLPLVTITFDSGGHIIEAAFDGNVFNADKMSDSEFAQAIVDSYDIPELKRVRDHDGTRWQYTSEDGIQVRVTLGFMRLVVLEAVPAGGFD